MPYNHTQEDFLKAAQDAGITVGNGFSEADWNLAMQNPDFGMSAITLKQDWRNAKTAEARALAHENLQQLRSSLGNYTARADGSGYIADPLSPSSFQADLAPTWADTYGDTYRNALDGVMNFQYNPDTDNLYSQYAKQYTREGRRATEDTLGTLAAASGGLPNSYAASAAAQAGNYYRAQMTDKIPELAQIAYNQKVNAFDAARQARQDDYNVYLNALNQYNTDRGFNYGVYTDELNDQRYGREQAWQQALNAAQYGGDYSWLNRLGVNTDNNPADYERRYNEAMLAAQYGDFSKLNAMGITPDAAALYNFTMASKGKTGSMGGGGGNGGSSSGGYVDTGSSDSDWVSQVAAFYGGKNLTAAQWDAFLQQNPSITADMMKAAGFTRMSATPDFDPYSDKMVEETKRRARERAKDIEDGKKYNLAGTPGLTTKSSSLMTPAQFAEARGRTPWLYTEYKNYDDYVKKNS